MKDEFKWQPEMVQVWSEDRLGRWVTHLTEIMNEFHDFNIDSYVNQQGIDTWKSSEKMVFGIH